MKLAFRQISLPALALALAACGLSPEERLDRAETAYAQHRFSEARLDLASVLEEGEADGEVLELLARTQLQLGDGDGALRSLQRMADTGHRPADLAAMTGEAQWLRGSYDAALAAVEGLDTAEGARIAALALVGQGELERAAERFAAGTGADGDRSRLLADYALFALRGGDAELAQTLATQARQADPAGLDPLIASARVAQSAGDLPQAARHYARAAEIWPESRPAMLGHAGVLADLGRLDEARPLIADAARRAPGDPDVIYMQARLSAEDGDWSAVREALQPLESREDARLQLLYARALVELDLTQQALGRLTALHRKSPRNAPVRRLLARAQLESGDAASAFATLRPVATGRDASPADLALYAEAARESGRGDAMQQALAAAPPAERIGTLLAEGDAAIAAGNWRAAVIAYEKLRGFTGDSNALVLNNLAYARSRTGDMDGALEVAEKALALAPDHPSVMDTAGWLLVQSDSDRARGLALLEQAARRAPDNPAIARHLREARGG